MQVIKGKNKNGYLSNDTIKFIFTDRLSVFDNVVGLVPRRGYILAECTRIIFNFLSKNNIETAMICSYDNWLVMEKCHPFYFEFILRNLLTGSALERAKQGSLQLPFNMECKEYTQFSKPFIEVSTKREAKDRYDLTDDDIKSIILESLPYMKEKEAMKVFKEAINLTSKISELLTMLFDKADLVLVDGKIELGLNNKNKLTLIDSFGPDEFRTFDKDWLFGDKSTPPVFYDKQFIRDKLKNARKSDYDRIIQENGEKLISLYENVTQRLEQAVKDLMS